MKKILKKLTPFISIVFFGFALWFLNRELQSYELAEITQQLSEIPDLNILISLGLSFLSYLILTGYDALGVDYIGEKLETGKIVRAGYVGYAFSHNIGLALITGGSIRYRIYSVWGFSGMQVTQIVAFSAFTLWIGFCSVAGLALIFATPDLPEDVMLPFDSLRILGGVLLIMVIGYLWACARFRDQITFRDWSFRFPGLSLALKQVGIASVDWLLAASVLYVLLPESGISFFSFVGVFLLAQIVGLFSQVPGGLGVFESVMLLYLTNFLPGSKVLGILLVYRLIYYILPLLGALIVLGYQEYKTNRQVVHRVGEKAAAWVPRVVPQVLSISVFIGGAILLFSGVLPSEVPRMQWLQHFIPLPVIEMSHFLASLVGAALLVLAGALQRRIDGAYHLTVGLIIFGIIFSLLKGADYEEASILAVMLAALIPCKQEFHRKASLFSQQYSARWFTMILIVLASAVWLGIFSYRHVEYQRELWWEFSLTGDAPRYLRAMVAVLGFTIIVGLIKLLRPKKTTSTKAVAQELSTAGKIIRRAGSSLANLALLRDKKLLFNDAQTAFIMYVEEGKSWISLGDPVGAEDEAEEMVWKFRDQADEHGFLPVFYYVGNENLDYYVDLGLTRFKLGEEAVVPLSNFNAGIAEPQIRTNCAKMEEQGYHWEILEKGAAEDHFLELKSVSHACMQSQNRKERGFSVGCFDRDYLKNFPIAVIKRGNDLLAFANILLSASKRELSTDLLRYRPQAADGIIDFMLLNTMRWGYEQGYGSFNLGIAPFSGMDQQDFSPSWNKLAHFAFTYGENFYRFKAVREYKNQFNPVWKPKYLVCPGGIALPRVLSNLTTVVSGSFGNLVNIR